ncbi:hypothetical protein [Nocardia puris]|uniref:Uncharacterized protein n=1 Tax=Nocardia puris TaxID=208602 RepID=A0A366CVL5_9NOCA|nr:hypothetical protein [Nocardia puris]RBO79531.1 hypothetical protein DFR74_1385 [Nocardia puris]
MTEEPWRGHARVILDEAIENPASVGATLARVALDDSISGDELVQMAFYWIDQLAQADPGTLHLMAASRLSQLQRWSLELITARISGDTIETERLTRKLLARHFNESLEYLAVLVTFVGISLREDIPGE